jgi:hypothetical protein
MKYKVNVSECYYGVSNDKLISKIIKAKSEYDLIDKIKSDIDISEYVYSDSELKDWHGGDLGYDKYESLIFEDDNNKFYLALNEEIEFECELLN